jgi:hypothetical protein
MHGFIVLDGTPPPEILRRGRPYCHGWEVRDEPIGILATGRPPSAMRSCFGSSPKI